MLNQTSRMEVQLLETSLSTNKLEKQLLLQGHELHRLQDHNRWALAPWHTGTWLRQGLGPGLGPRWGWDPGWAAEPGLDWGSCLRRGQGPEPGTWHRTGGRDCFRGQGWS